MGAVLIVVAVTGATIAPTFQAGIGAWIEDLILPIVRFLEPIPDLVTGLVLVGIGVAAVLISGRRRKPLTEEETEGNCHEPTDANETATLS